MMEDQNLGVVLENTESTSSQDTPTRNLDSSKNIVGEQDLIVSIIEDAFPKEHAGKAIGNPQADALRLAERIFYIWVWPIIAIRKIRNLISRMDFVKPYTEAENSYVVTDTETVYTMTKEAFSGKGGMKFFGIRFMSIWVFPMAIMGIVMELLFVSPIKGTNPFG